MFKLLVLLFIIKSFSLFILRKMNKTSKMINKRLAEIGLRWPVYFSKLKEFSTYIVDHTRLLPFC